MLTCCLYWWLPIHLCGHFHKSVSLHSQMQLQLHGVARIIFLIGGGGGGGGDREGSRSR